MYVFDSTVVRRGCRRGELWGWLLMESTCFQCARARLAPARARSVPSPPFSHSNIILILPSFVSASPPLSIPLACPPTSLTLSFLPSPSLLAPLGPRNKHTATHGATPSARSLRGRHNRRRKLPFPRAFRPTIWHRVSSPPASQGHM
jgi:hypothetical protein